MMLRHALFGIDPAWMLLTDGMVMDVE